MGLTGLCTSGDGTMWKRASLVGLSNATAILAKRIQVSLRPYDNPYDNSERGVGIVTGVPTQLVSFEDCEKKQWLPFVKKS